MKININSLHTQIGNKASFLEPVTGEQAKNQAAPDVGNESSTVDTDTNETQSDFDLTLVKGSAYEQIFNKEDLDFSNMSLNELYSLVQDVNAMHREYAKEHGNDEPTRIGRFGTPIISKEREALLDLEGTLEVLSFGDGRVDPNEKIDVAAYFSNQAELATAQAKAAPERDDYSISASYMKEIRNTVGKFILDDTFELYKEKAAVLLTDKPKVNTYI
ncbi:hypothetical protein [Pseudoalteromonas sp. MMG005]|uniref:hypothetical protein n=1 Tax=Pseudoalteromonas sp. MMG005 TaxID=2822682 RepID=UPI001B3A1E38|nr:hypothetical protein [Pseudoalteromonas sp. MMG005]MBQ4845056.1 hypothetical protein [Pseudoalteromonas sp. MMG005]